jgi:hypothetical protein
MAPRTTIRARKPLPKLLRASPNSTATFPAGRGFIGERAKRFSLAGRTGYYKKSTPVLLTPALDFDILYKAREGFALVRTCFARSPRTSGVGFSAGGNNIHVATAHPIPKLKKKEAVAFVRPYFFISGSNRIAPDSALGWVQCLQHTHGNSP